MESRGRDCSERHARHATGHTPAGGRNAAAVVVVVVVVVMMVVIPIFYPFASRQQQFMVVTRHVQVSVTCERTRTSHVFDVFMTSEEPEQHEVCSPQIRNTLCRPG